jgi:hypothetical protein
LVAAAPVIAEVVAGVTTDEDGTTISGDYVLSTPPGETTVNPITTMVQSTMESNPNISKDEAEEALKTNLGLTDPGSVDLFEDYVALEATGNDYEKIHHIAQVTADVLESQMDAVEAAAEAAGVDVQEAFDEIVRIVVSEVIDQLDTIESAVEAATSGDGTLDESEIDNITDTNVQDVDTSTIEEEVAAEQAVSDATESSMQTALVEGITWMWSEVERGDYEYGILTVDASTGVPTETPYYWDWEANTPTWVADSEPHQSYLLGASGWSLYNELADETIAFSGNDGIVSLNGVAVESIVGVETDLEGLAIKNIVAGNGFGDAVGSQVFSAGATGYLLTFTRLVETYEIGIWDDPDCETNGNLVGTSSPYCNSVNVDGSNITSLIGLFVSASSNGDCESAGGALWMGNNFVGELIHDSQTVISGDSGTANFFSSADNCWDQDANTDLVSAGTGTWEAVTVNGELLVMVNTPASAGEYMWLDEGDTLFYAVHDDYVRQGQKEPAGVDPESEWVLNDVGRNDFLSAFNPPAPASGGTSAP